MVGGCAEHETAAVIMTSTLDADPACVVGDKRISTHKSAFTIAIKPRLGFTSRPRGDKRRSFRAALANKISTVCDVSCY